MFFSTLQNDVSGRLADRVLGVDPRRIRRVDDRKPAACGQDGELGTAQGGLPGGLGRGRLAGHGSVVPDDGAGRAEGHAAPGPVGDRGRDVRRDLRL